MKPVERIEYMIKMESLKKDKDDAGVFIPGGLDSAIKIKAYQECLQVVKAKQ